MTIKVFGVKGSDYFDEEVEVRVDSKDVVLAESDTAFIDVKLKPYNKSVSLSFKQLQELQARISEAIEMIENE